MDYKGQTAAIFFLVGMMFLVSSGTEKALAAPTTKQIASDATGTCGTGTNVNSCEFTFKDKGLSSGSWVAQPSQSGTRVTWATTGGGAGNEEGWVKYEVQSQATKDKMDVTMNFKNPVIGKNSCSISPSSAGSCTAGSGQSAAFTYRIIGPK